MVEGNKKKLGIWKWLGIVTGGFLLIAFTLSWYLNSKLRPMLTDKLKEYAYKSSNGLYKLNFKSVNVNFITGNFTMHDISLVPDTTTYKKLDSLHLAPDNLYTLKLKKLSIKNIHPYTMYKEGKVAIDDIILDEPEIRVVNKRLPYNQDKPAKPGLALYSYISKFAKEVSVDKILFNAINLTVVNKNIAKEHLTELKKLDIAVTDFLIDSLSEKDPSRFYFTKDISLHLRNYQMATQDSLYYLKFEGVSLSSSKRQLVLKQVLYEPRYTEMEFGKSIGENRDRFDIRFEDVSLNNIDLPLFLQHNKLWASTLIIDKGSVAVFSDNTLPKKIAPKIGKYPHQLLQKLALNVKIDTLHLSNTNVSYAEYDRDSHQKGIVSFNHTKGRFLNITNDTLSKVKNPNLMVSLQTSLMNSGSLSVNFKFDLTSKKGNFSYNGALTNMDLDVLNRVTRPLGLIEVKRGHCNELSFDITADDQVADGKVGFRYNDLGVAVLKYNKEYDGLRRRGLMSLLANVLLIDKSNPLPGQTFKPVQVHYNRNINASFFNFLWKTLFQGAKLSVGVTPQREQHIRQQIEMFKNIKDSAEKRKAGRVKRREARKVRKKLRKEKLAQIEAAMKATNPTE